MFDLTIPQQNLWNLQTFYSGTSISNLCGAVFFGQCCDHRLLEEAVNALIAEQSGMRLRFREEGGRPVQYVADYTPESFPSAVFCGREELEAFALHYGQVPFAMTDSPMYRFTLFDVEGQSGVLLCANHLIADAWSFGLIAHSVWAHCQGVTEVQGGDYRTFVQGEQKYLTSLRYEKDQAYWAEQYPAKPEISSIRPNSPPFQSPKAGRYTTRMTGEMSVRMEAFHQEKGITQAVLFEAAMIAYLARINPEHSHISIGALVLNRSGVEKQAVGMCVSTIPLTVPVSGELTMEELCRQVSARQFQLFRHQRYPYSHILRDLHQRYGFSGNLYDVIVSFQNAKTEAQASTQWFSNGYCEVGMEFHIDDRDGAGRYTLNVDYQTELFPGEGEVALVVERILSILDQIMTDPTMTLDRLSILPKGERERVLYTFNATEEQFPRTQCVHQLIQTQAARTPDHTAVVFRGEVFTYRQVDWMSNALAHLLQERGIGPGEIVPIISKRSHLVLVAMLGVLKAGAAYMPVDPTYPRERMAYMFEDARARVALTFGYEGPLELEAIDLAQVDFDRDPTPLDNCNTPEDLCYVIFTSGSTGRPKGVMIPHRTVVNYISPNGRNVVGAIIKPEHRSIVSVGNIIFDIFVTESLLPLANGMTVYFADEEECVHQRALGRLIRENRIDIFQATPTKMRSYQLDKGDLDYLSTLKAIFIGGEAFPVDLYGELRKHTEVDIFNIYGPAETTVWSTLGKVISREVTVGRPIANTQVYILDEKGNPLPIGVAGELCISGEGVGKGYLNRPDLTAERFLPDPFVPGNTLYRTGDLARWRIDGELDYLGRMDTQVKIRGLRIELGEIESVMASFEGVQLVAVADKRDGQGRQYLVGYYTAEQELDERALRQHLSAKLPKYMVPNYFVHLDQMPMTASGKTERKSLPDPVFGTMEREYIPPKNEGEARLCTILADLFQLERVGAEDDFFDLGGDSLRAIEYVARANSAGVSFALQNVFDYPTTRQLTAFLAGEEQVKVSYSPADFDKYRPLLDRNVIDTGFKPEKRSLGDVLLTGATGFLGSHILDRLVGDECGKIYCLVRGGEERLASVLDYYFGERYREELGGRIIPIDGDVTDPRLAQEMPESVQTVIHAAATVKHYGTYGDFYDVNVTGTQNIISYAHRVGARLVHISTLSVSGNSLADNFDVYRAQEELEFDERSLYIGQPLDNVYVHSKFEAERAVLDSALDGLPVHIIRVGNLTNRASDFKFQPNYRSNSFLTRLKAALELGAIPDYLLPLYAEFSPIDQMAEGVVRIAQYAGERTVFHLYNYRHLYFDRMVTLLNELGVPMEVISGETFYKKLKTGDLSRYEAFQNDLDEDGRLIYDSNIRLKHDVTRWFLEQVGFQWAEIDRDYLKGYLDYFRGLGYLKV